MKRWALPRLRRGGSAIVPGVFPWMLIAMASFGTGIVAFILPRAVVTAKAGAVSPASAPLITPMVVKLKLVQQGVGSFPKIDDEMTPFITSSEGGAWAKFVAIDSNNKIADPTTLPIGGMQMVQSNKLHSVDTSLTREAVFVQVPRLYGKPPIGATFAVRYPSSIQNLAPEVVGKLVAASPPDMGTAIGSKMLKTVKGQFVQVARDTGRIDFKGESKDKGIITIRPTGGLTVRSFDDGTRVINSSIDPQYIPEVWRFPYFQARFANAGDTITAAVSYLVREEIDEIIELPPLPVNIHFGQPCAEPTRGIWFAPSPRVQMRLGNNPRIPKRTPRHVNRTVLIPVLVYGTHSHLRLQLEFPNLDQLPFRLQLDGNYTTETAPPLLGQNHSTPLSDTVIRGLKIHVTGTTYRAIASDTREFKLVRQVDTSLPSFGFRRG